jgi:hypothetical protein
VIDVIDVIGVIGAIGAIGAAASFKYGGRFQRTAAAHPHTACRPTHRRPAPDLSPRGPA